MSIPNGIQGVVPVAGMAGNSAEEGVVGVFLMEISPRPAEVDPWLWVIVGDLPPAYLVLNCRKTPVEALRN